MSSGRPCQGFDLAHTGIDLPGSLQSRLNFQRMAFAIAASRLCCSLLPLCRVVSHFFVASCVLQTKSNYCTTQDEVAQIPTWLLLCRAIHINSSQCFVVYGDFFSRTSGFRALKSCVCTHIPTWHQRGRHRLNVERPDTPNLLTATWIANNTEPWSPDWYVLPCTESLLGCTI